MIGSMGSLALGKVKLGVASAHLQQGVSVSSGQTFAQAKAALGPSLVQAPAFVQAPAPEPEGLPRSLVIGGAAVVGLGLVAAIVYKARKKR